MNDDELDDLISLIRRRQRKGLSDDVIREEILASRILRFEERHLGEACGSLQRGTVAATTGSRSREYP